jgi:hypothetical protein
MAGHSYHFVPVAVVIVTRLFQNNDNNPYLKLRNHGNQAEIMNDEQAGMLREGPEVSVRTPPYLIQYLFAFDRSDNITFVLGVSAALDSYRDFSK